MQKLAVAVKEACEALSISRSTLYARLAEPGPLRTITVGRRRLITTESIRALVGNNATSDEQGQ